MSFKVYIPARLAATRLKEKLLREVDGQPLICHTVARAFQSGASEVVVATDHQRIADAVSNTSASVVMTAIDHLSGSDRLGEAVKIREESQDTVVVNLQGDEPLMPAAVIEQVAGLIIDGQREIATVCEPLAEAQYEDPNVVKVVRSAAQTALYFSRASIPFDREGTGDRSRCRRHVGIYGYRVRTLLRFLSLPAAPLETLEKLEQLRALYHGLSIEVADAVEPCGIGVDTPADLKRLRALVGGP
ncbi:MAG: 3-deoxy-manno-octulosonate cytidylyltransferase [Pseudomonadota bacterium]